MKPTREKSKYTKGHTKAKTDSNKGNSYFHCKLMAFAGQKS